LISSQASEGFPEFRLKPSPLDPIELSDTSDTELVDLAHVVPQAAAKEYRKAGPQLSYSTGEKPQLPLLQNDQDLPSSESFDSPGSEEFEGFDPAKDLHGMNNLSAPLPDPDMFSASFQDSSMHGFQTGMVENEPSLLSTVPQPKLKLDSGNSNDPFDVAASQNLFDQDFNDQNFFDHFNDQDFNDQNFYGEYYEESQGQNQFSAEQSTNAETSSPFATETSSKRPLSPNVKQSASKQPRLSSTEPATGPSQLPEWTNEIDHDLIKSLMNSVEFEDEHL
jgi:hypothetical protein